MDILDSTILKKPNTNPKHVSKNTNSLFSIPQSTPMNLALPKDKHNKNRAQSFNQLQQLSLLHPPKQAQMFSSRNTSNFDLNNVSTNKSIKSYQKQSLFPPSLGVIVSEQQTNSLPKRRNNAQVQSYKVKVQELTKELQKSNSERQQVIEQKQGLKKVHNQFRMNIMKQKQKLQYQFNIRQQREISRLNYLHGQEMSKKQEIYKWKEQQVYNTHQLHIQQLKSTIQVYESVIKNTNNNNHMNTNTNTSSIVEHSSVDDHSKQYYEHKERELQTKYNQLLQEQKQHNHKVICEQDKLRREKAQFNRYRVQKQAQMRQELKQLQQKAHYKCEQYNRKLQAIQQQQQEIQLQQIQVQKQRHNIQELTERLNAKYKQQIQQVHQQKQYLYSLQHQFLQDIRILQLMLNAQSKKSPQNKQLIQSIKNNQYYHNLNTPQYQQHPQYHPHQFNNLIMDLKNKKLYPKSKENINFKAYLLNLNKRKKY